MPNAVCLISLLPLSATGGGESFSSNAAHAIAASGDSCLVFSPERMLPHHAALPERLAARFHQLTPRPPHTVVRKLDFRAVLDATARCDILALHQFLASDLVFDIIANACSDQFLLFTTLGYEPLRPLLEDLYQPSPNHHFLEISGFAALRSRVFSRQVAPVAAGIWQADLLGPVPPKDPFQICALGRVLPHKGLEVTIDALPPGMHLTIAGPAALDPAYSAFLQQRSQGKSILFTGRVTDPVRNELLARSRILVASSCTELYTGQRVEQAELLGLVIFEALAHFCLPVVSDVPSFVEVMHALNLHDWIYPQRDSQALQKLLIQARDTCVSDAVLQARQRLVGRFDWDSYWPRVLACL